MNLNKIRVFLQQTSGVKPKQVTTEARLLHDLYVYGDDAVDFLNYLQQEFGVDISRFDFQRYFPTEGGFNFIIYFKKKLEQRYKPLTIQTILDAIDNGELE